VERVHLAIKSRRREAERVLVVQLVGDARKRGVEIVGAGQLEVAAAGGRGNLRQARVRLVGLRRSPEPASAAAESAAAAAAKSAAAMPATAAAGRPAATRSAVAAAGRTAAA